MPALPPPLANQLLIALPALTGTDFSRSVALICQHDADGAMAIVVNRPSEYTLGEVLGQMGVEGGDESLRGQIVLAGGPVHPERGFVLHDGGLRWDSSLGRGGGGPGAKRNTPNQGARPPPPIRNCCSRCRWTRAGRPPPAASASISP